MVSVCIIKKLGSCMEDHIICARNVLNQILEEWCLTYVIMELVQYSFLRNPSTVLYISIGLSVLY